MLTYADLGHLWPGRPLWRLGCTNSHAACTELLPGAVGKRSFLHGVCSVEDLQPNRPSLRQEGRTANSQQAPDGLRAMLPSESKGTAWLAAHLCSTLGQG